jgi:hypothetical protein
MYVCKYLFYTYLPQICEKNIYIKTIFKYDANIPVLLLQILKVLALGL